VIIDIVSIFPDMFEGPLSTSIIGSARERGLLEVRCHDLRDWTYDKHRSTDDSPYGGGPGMVMKPQPLFEAMDAVQALEAETVAGNLVLSAMVGKKTRIPGKRVGCLRTAMLTRNFHVRQDQDGRTVRVRSALWPTRWLNWPAAVPTRRRASPWSWVTSGWFTSVPRCGWSG